MKRHLRISWGGLVLFFSFLSVTVGIAAEPKEPSRAELSRIEARAKEIVGYEQASIRATDIMLSGKFDESKLGGWVALHRNGKWTVYFGKISKDEKRYVPAYVYSCPEGKFGEMRQVEVKEEPKDLLPLAQAINLAAGAIKEPLVPRYNSDVFREADGTITVYLTPGTTEPDVLLLGGDFRVSLSGDGKKILKSEKLHSSILTFKEKMEKLGETTAGGYHTHILGELPTETEVALLMLHPLLTPHIIAGKNWMFSVEKDGTIRFLGKSKEVLEKYNKKK